MKILITGAHGFLGKNLIPTLQQHGYTNLITPTHKQYDLTNPQQTHKLLTKTKPHTIIHLAATVGGIQANQQNPATYFYNNATMGINLIHQAHQHNTNQIIIIGTVCSYPKHTPTPFKETNLWNGYPEETNAPYGIAKKILLTQLQAYKQQHGTNSAYLIPTNLYGPHDNYNPNTSHVIPAIIYKTHQAQKNNQNTITLWGTGNATREFLYAKDCAKAITQTINKINNPTPINLGTNTPTTIKNLAHTITQLMNYKGTINWDTTKPDGQPQRHLNTTQAKTQLNWTPTTTLTQGLKQTIQWYKQNHT